MRAAKDPIEFRSPAELVAPALGDEAAAVLLRILRKAGESDGAGARRASGESGTRRVGER